MKKKINISVIVSSVLVVLFLIGLILISLNVSSHNKPIVYDNNKSLVTINPNDLEDLKKVNKLFDGSSLYITYAPEGSLPEGKGYDEIVETGDFTIGISRFKNEENKPLITLVKCVNGVYNKYMYMWYENNSSLSRVQIGFVGNPYILEPEDKGWLKGMKEVKPIIDSLLYSYEGGIAKER